MAVKDKDRGFKKLTKSLGQLTSATISIGYTKPELAQRAAWNEFGTSTIPPRPFMRRALDQRRNQPGFDKRIGELVDGKADGEKTNKELGDIIKVAIQTQIDTSPSWAKRNAASTVDKKGFDFPLVDSGSMRDGVKVKVSKRGVGGRFVR